MTGSVIWLPLTLLDTEAHPLMDFGDLITYIEILTHRRQATSNRWCHLLSGEGYKLPGGATKISSAFPVLKLTVKNCVNGLLTVIGAHDCLSMSI